MLLQLSTWQEVEQYLQHSKAIIIPIGSTEQHGPNGFIGTDAICPETIARNVADEIDTLIAPTISIGMAQHHLAFSGSITLRPTTLIAVIVDVVDSLAVHGFEKFYFLNGHGGNVATINTAFAEIYAATSLAHINRKPGQIQLKLQSWWNGARVHSLSRELYGAAEGSHATPSEVSITYFAYPHTVKNVTLSPDIAPYGKIRDALDYRQQFPDGRIGSNPLLATIEAGERLCKAAVQDTIESFQAFITETR